MDTIDRNVTLACGGALLDGHLELPPRAVGIVLFAHGSATSRYSARNLFAAGRVLDAGLGIFVVDLVAVEEAAKAGAGRRPVDQHTIARRVVAVLDWLASTPETRGLPVGLFGAGIAAAAAVRVAAENPGRVASVVVRGARVGTVPAPVLARLQVPTLLIVGEKDVHRLAENQAAFEMIRCERRLDVIPGAGHRFEDETAFLTLVTTTCDWFLRHMSPPAVHATADRL